MTAKVANWLLANLQNKLPEGVKVNLSTLVVSGHSRGGKTAFALALGLADSKLQVEVSGVIGVDPVAGISKWIRTEPHILSDDIFSNLLTPTLVIGTGLGNHSRWLPPFIFGPCAPNGVNHQAFYEKCRNGTHFVVTDYGHMDMLNENVSPIAFLGRAILCATGRNGRDPMRRTVGGLIVAYLKFCLLGEPEDYNNIIANPSLAPARLAKPEVKPVKDGYYSEM